MRTSTSMDNRAPAAKGGRPTEGVRRFGRVVALAVGIAVAAVALFLLPDLVYAIPLELQIRWTTPLPWLTAAAALALFGRVWFESGRSVRLRRVVGWIAAALERGWETARASRAGALLDRLDGLAGAVLRGPAPWAIGALAAALWLAWAPHYLTWAWWVDTDQFAISALSWHAGLVPFRDLQDFDFPGPIYPLYVLGQLFGWGRTVPYNAFDAALLALLGVALAVWGRRALGSALAGLIGFLPFLGAYLCFNYDWVAQRDWHGPLFAVLGLLALEAWPGRAGRVASALGMAAALAYRPQVVLFLPAVASALLEGCEGPGWSRAKAARALVEWAGLFAAALVLAFSPLIVAGVFDDFLRLLRVARYGGSYNHVTWFTFMKSLREQLWGPFTFWVLAAAVALAVAGPDPLRRRARTWALALLGVLIYKPMSPIQHDYLNQPVWLVRSVGLAPVAAWVLTAGTPARAAVLRLAAVAWLVATALPQVPGNCKPSWSLRAARALARGEAPADAPPGCEKLLPSRSQRRGANYQWEDYVALIAYLRDSAPPGARVANLLRALPYPAVNGPAGRLTPFPAAGGIIHLWQVDPGLEDQFKDILEHSTDTLVVWAPGLRAIDHKVRFPRLVRVVRRRYRPLARFGSMEVWRYAGPVPPDGAGPPQGVEADDTAFESTEQAPRPVRPRGLATPESRARGEAH